MGACRDGVSGTVGSDGVRMREVKMRFGRDPLEQSGFADKTQLIPAHMWQFHTRRERADASGENPQTVKLWGFFTGIIESLQSQANSEKGHTAAQSVEKGRAQTTFIERANQRGEMSDAGKNECLGAPETFRSGRSL